MALQNSLVLDINTNALFTRTDDDLLVINHGDLSQLGLTRGQLKPLLQIPISKDILLVFPGSAKNPFWKNFFTILDTTPADHDIRLKVDTSAMHKAKFGTTEPEHLASIKTVQDSLDPAMAASHDDIMKSDRIVQRVANLSRREGPSRQLLHTAINEALATNEQLRRYLTLNNYIADEASTERDEPYITRDSFETIDYPAMLSIGNLMKDMSDSVANAYKVVEFSLMYAVLKDDESIGDHPLLADSYATAKAETMIKAYRAPNFLQVHFTKRSHGEAVLVTAQIGKDGNFTDLPVNNGRASMLGEFAFYFTSFKQIVPTTVERAHDFAFSRLLVLRHGLFYDSNETCNVNVTAQLVIDSADIAHFVSAFQKPEKYYACLYASVISFLKSGHHATAANLDNTLMHIFGSLGITTNIDQVRNIIPFAVYNGPHVASMRLTYAYLLYKNSREKITNSVALRLFPNPPGATAYCNLEIFINALHSARFFEVLDRMDEYIAFKTQMKEIKRTMWHVAPYAMYLFNKTAVDPVSIKQEIAKMAGYATALTGAMPNTSLAMSPALSKLASENGRNTFSAGLLVNAYVAGFTRFFRHSIEARMAKVYGVPRGALTL
jgi:hypothetical protein